MIGGSDCIIPAPDDPTSLDLCCRVVMAVWPGCTFEDATTGERYAGFADIPFGQVRELFAHRDAENYVYLIRTATGVTVVYEPCSPDMAGILEGCLTMLRTYRDRLQGVI
jgi:hypothetical protein